MGFIDWITSLFEDEEEPSKDKSNRNMLVNYSEIKRTGLFNAEDTDDNPSYKLLSYKGGSTGFIISLFYIKKIGKEEKSILKKIDLSEYLSFTKITNDFSDGAMSYIRLELSLPEPLYGEIK